MHHKTFSNAHQRTRSASAGNNHTDSKHESPNDGSQADWYYITHAWYWESFREVTILDGGKANGRKSESDKHSSGQRGPTGEVGITHRGRETKTRSLQYESKSDTRHPEKS